MPAPSSMANWRPGDEFPRKEFTNPKPCAIQVVAGKTRFDGSLSLNEYLRTVDTIVYPDGPPPTSEAVASLAIMVTEVHRMVSEMHQSNRQLIDARFTNLVGQQPMVNVAAVEPTNGWPTADANGTTEGVVGRQISPDDGSGASPTRGKSAKERRDLILSATDGEHTTKAEITKTQEEAPAPDGSEHFYDLGEDGGIGALFGKGDGDLRKPPYRVEKFYHKTGLSQKLAQNAYWCHFGLAMVMLNAVYIGVDADWNHAKNLYDADLFFFVSENAFALFFSVELLVRFCAFRRKVDFFKDGWCRFDLLLVLLMIVEVWIIAPLTATGTMDELRIPIEVLRLLRLARLTRMSRMTKELPELLTLTKSLVAGCRAVFSSLMFITVLTYTFAIALNSFMGTKDEFNARVYPKGFKTVGRTMWTLILDGTFMLSTDKLLLAMIESTDVTIIMSSVIFDIFVLLSAVTLMNMLIGSLCEVVCSVAQSEKDSAAISKMKGTILRHLLEHDDGDGFISRDELFEVMRHPQASAAFTQLNIDKRYLAEISVALYPKAESHIEMGRVMELMLMCRGDTGLTVKHIAYLQESLVTQFHDMLDEATQDLAKERCIMPPAAVGTKIA